MSTHGDNPFAAFAFKASPSHSMSSAAASPSHPSPEYANPARKSLPLQREVERYEGDSGRTHQVTETGKSVSKTRDNPRSRGVAVSLAPPNGSSGAVTPRRSRAPRDTPSQESWCKAESQGPSSSSTFSSRLGPVKAATEGCDGGPCVIEIISSPEASCRGRHSDESGSDDGRQEEECNTEKRAEAVDEEADFAEERPWRGEWRRRCSERAPGSSAVSQSCGLAVALALSLPHLCFLPFVSTQSSAATTLRKIWISPFTVKAVADTVRTKSGVELCWKDVVTAMQAVGVSRAEVVLRENEQEI